MYRLNPLRRHDLGLPLRATSCSLLASPWAAGYKQYLHSKTLPTPNGQPRPYVPDLNISSHGPSLARKRSPDVLPRTSRRTSSTASQSHQDLLSRVLPRTWDFLTPSNSYLLTSTLSSFLPILPPDSLPHLSPVILPPGHHLVYFSPPTPPHRLLPDGTDPLHWPGPPFMRRMWAGGTLDLVPPAPGSSQSERATARLRLDGRRAVCDESITNVRETGKVGEEKLWVTVERRMRNEDSDILGLVETRDLVFLQDRERKSGALLEVNRPEATLPRRVVKAPHKATFSNTLIPTRELLFRFSALTFNAHAIHLDVHLTRVVEGYERMLVHGPLTLVLMLEVAGARLRESKGSSWELKRIEYRNLAPLMVEEEMRVCGRERAESGEMEVWVEGPGGSMAARGTVFTGRRSE